jgi:cellulose synthase/poly-beta-1,6-N-acetylglucosamine synthase-like glycosyltransferase
MLAALLLAGLFAATLATIWLFLPTGVRGRSIGVWAWSRRLTLALAGTAVLDAIAVGCLHAIGVTRTNTIAGVAGFSVISVLWLPFTRRWSARAHLCWAGTTYLFVSYLAFMLNWTFVSHLGAAATAGGLLLWLLEFFAALLGCAYLWELCDALGSEEWRRRLRRGAPAQRTAGEQPFVSLHVPAYNEPPEMVIATLESLRRLDYSNYEIVVIDDNSTDESMWRPVEAWCGQHEVKFVHLDNWPGYKSGALNYALKNLTDPQAQLVGVVDSDYQIDPEFLKRTAPLFADPKVGFIQAPQDYRGWQHAPYYRRLYYSYVYFFVVSQPSRNERDGAIFAGTMGLIRRRALEQVGGWDEWCITEDAELSLRLLRNGWSGLHVDRSFGKGVMPLTFEALKGQRFRWCFGGIQILRRHWRWMMPGPRTGRNPLTLGQRWAYLSGAVQWYGDLLGLLFFVFLLAGAGNIVFGGGLIFRKLTGFLVAAIPLLVGLGLIRAVGLLRRSTGATWREAIGAFGIWQSTGVACARASVQALYARQAHFLRTPKTSEEGRPWDAIKGNPAETLLGLLGLAAIVGTLGHLRGYGAPLTAALLVWPTVAYLAAPANSLAAQRAAIPPDLRARRRTEWLRYGGVRRASVAAGGLAVVGGTVALALALLSSGRSFVITPQVVNPAQGKPVSYNTRSPAPSTAPSTGSPTPTTSPSSPAPTSPVPTTSTPATTPSPSPSLTSTP